MEGFLQQCVDRYKQLAGVQHLREAWTPFHDDRTTVAEQRKEYKASGDMALGSKARTGLHPGNKNSGLHSRELVHAAGAAPSVGDDEELPKGKAAMHP